MNKQTGMLDVDGVMILVGDKVGYKDKEYRVSFKNYSFVLVNEKGTLIEYFHNIKKKVTIIGRGL
jgi:hypothetical protein